MTSTSPTTPCDAYHKWGTKMEITFLKNPPISDKLNTIHCNDSQELGNINMQWDGDDIAHTWKIANPAKSKSWAYV